MRSGCSKRDRLIGLERRKVESFHCSQFFRSDFFFHFAMKVAFKERLRLAQVLDFSAEMFSDSELYCCVGISSRNGNLRSFLDVWD